MKDDIWRLLSTIVVAIFAFGMYSVAGFFYSNLQEITRVCSQYSYSDCRANESIQVSMASLKTGIVLFFSTGSISWMVASYLVLRWNKIRPSAKLP